VSRHSHVACRENTFFVSRFCFVFGLVSLHVLCGLLFSFVSVFFVQLTAFFCPISLFTTRSLKRPETQATNGKSTIRTPDFFLLHFSLRKLLSRQPGWNKKGKQRKEWFPYPVTLSLLLLSSPSLTFLFSRTATRRALTILLFLHFFNFHLFHRAVWRSHQSVPNFLPISLFFCPLFSAPTENKALLGRRSLETEERQRKETPEKKRQSINGFAEGSDNTTQHEGERRRVFLFRFLFLRVLCVTSLSLVCSARERPQLGHSRLMWPAWPHL